MGRSRRILVCHIEKIRRKLTFLLFTAFGAMRLGRCDPVFILQSGIELKLNRFGAALSVLAAGALILSGCGSDKNASNGAGGNSTTGQLPVKVNCGGKKTLRASGAAAQVNAMTRFVNAFEAALPGPGLA